MDPELVFSEGQDVRDQTIGLRERNCGIMPLNDLAEVVFPEIRWEGRGDDREIQLLNLPPSIASVLEFDLDNSDSLVQGLEKQPIGLTPSWSFLPGFEEIKPRARDIIPVVLK